MNNTAVTIDGKEYVYQGVTDLEIMPLTEVFGTERPEEGTKEYRDWEKQFMRKFADYSSQRAIAFFLLCAFPDLPESIVKYTVRRLPDGTEECRPGRDLRVKIGAKEFEQIVLLISSELKKIEQKLIQERGLRKMTFDTGTPNISPDAIERREATRFVLDDADIEQEELTSSTQRIDPHEIAKVVEALLERRQEQQDKKNFLRGRIEARVEQPDEINLLRNRVDKIIRR